MPLDREWTDEDLKTYFEITDEEWALIEERANPKKKPRRPHRKNKK